MPILLIDSYDSFTGNLRSLLERSSGLPVVTVHNDALTAQELHRFLPLFDAVVVGPGPGHPALSEDIGMIMEVFCEETVPILGVCLGFQALCLSQGGKVVRAQLIRHGQVATISTNGNSDLFRGIPQSFNAVRYHSLCVDDLPEQLDVLAVTTDTCGKVVMAVQRKGFPWFGVQYHPESVCSDHGDKLIKNFMSTAYEFNSTRRNVAHNETLMAELISTTTVKPLLSSTHAPSPYKLHKIQIVTNKSALDICQSLHDASNEFVLLNSAAAPGQWSIIGVPSQTSLRVSHSTEAPNTVQLSHGGKKWEKNVDDIWSFISQHMSSVLSDKTSNLPFVGGFMGLFSYEEGHHLALSTLPKLTKSHIPDTKLVFIENCILINNSTHTAYITSLIDDIFIREMTPLVSPSASTSSSSSSIRHNNFIDTHYICRPDKDEYISKFHACQELLRSGDSYELCLTVPTKIGIPSATDPWEIFKTLTSRNPSPYSAYFNFDECILLSSSPERFISWDSTLCQLRPIKGTVRKTPDMTFEKASEILNTPKELGENLMIVDLIRHDLYQFLDRVEVTKLMTVEEYKTVYQLVSVIEGHLEGTCYTGIDVLSRALPPGSMTGAPKKRSVEILQRLENNRRGLYSGVAGYWSIEDKADWSVIIRSLFHYKDDIENTTETSLWRIGAGGAITVLSDAEGEWLEMLTKLDSALGVFGS